MKFLTDANVPMSLVKALRKEGHDVKDAKEEGMTRAADRIILETAKEEQRTIITLDQDFKHIAQTLQDAAHGIILLRYKHQSATTFKEEFIPLIENELKGKTNNAIITVSEDATKIKRMK